jgi:hypothetical protein
MSVTPVGGAYFPSRWRMSGRFTPAAETRIRTSEAPIFGISRVHQTQGIRSSGGGDFDRLHDFRTAPQPRRTSFSIARTRLSSTHRIQHGIDSQHDQPGITRGKGAFEQGDRTRILPQSDLDRGEPVGREARMAQAVGERAGM